MQSFKEYLMEGIEVHHIKESFWVNTKEYKSSAKKQSPKGFMVNTSNSPESKVAQKKLTEMLTKTKGKVDKDILAFVNTWKRKNEDTIKFKEFINNVYKSKATINYKKNSDGKMVFGDLLV